ncbi:hypothetical protein BCR34DRAFT_552209 [Clohesyomyces aquaticus]|uniref:Uncharacterized protein n=1 Tax=Clohesyomyces aquaticus TaxID=1231657 RepID=A0A1Y2AAJ1_9PLEO|nr:hypothetical protein BCR34DRAFT_552209 [Clohesyomyces aquaticus]
MSPHLPSSETQIFLNLVILLFLHVSFALVNTQAVRWLVTPGAKHHKAIAFGDLRRNTPVIFDAASCFRPHERHIAPVHSFPIG